MTNTIALLGVGSTYFTKGIIEALARRGGSWDVRLVDIDERCLDIATRLARRVAEAYGVDMKITGSTDRRDVLSGCDAVVATIGVGGRTSWEEDMYLAREFDIYQSTADTFGAGGVSRSLRQVPTMMAVARDMERLCPGALLVNFSNPMSVLCRAITRETSVKTVGLCMGVRDFQRTLARVAGVPDEEVFCEAVGVNHFTWITGLYHDGVDVLPKVRAELERTGERPGGPYTWEMFQAFDAFPVVGDGHILEFVPGWQGKGAYYGKTFGVDNHDFTEYARHWDRVFARMERIADGATPVDVRPDGPEKDTFEDEDFFAEVMMAFRGEAAFHRTVNLPNDGTVANLPRGAVLEATTYIADGAFRPLAFGDVPRGIAAVNARIIGAQELTVEAALTGDRKLVVQALLAGLTVRTLEEAERLTDRIFEVHRRYLPQFFDDVAPEAATVFGDVEVASQV